MHLTDKMIELITRGEQAVLGAVNSGIYLTVSKLISRVEGFVNSSNFNASSSRQYGVPLIEGVRGAMNRQLHMGWVHVLGNTKANDGTWRLRFFEGGTRQRGKRDNHNRGRIGPNWFFKAGIRGADETVSLEIQNAIDNAIKNITKE